MILAHGGAGKYRVLPSAVSGSTPPAVPRSADAIPDRSRPACLRCRCDLRSGEATRAPEHEAASPPGPNVSLPAHGRGHRWYTQTPMTDEYLLNMLGIAADMAGADGATLFLVDGEILRPWLIYHLPIAYIEGIGEVRVGTQCCGRAVEHKRPWIVSE